MKAIYHTVLLLAALLGANSAVAADRADGLISKEVELGDFGTCVARVAPAQSKRLLHTPLASPQERDAANILARGHASCIHRAVLTGRTGAIRGVVAQAMLSRDAALLDRIAARPAAAPVRPEAAKGREFLIRYGQCLLDADPAHTAALLRTGYDTPEERSAFLAYGDTLKSCMAIGVQYNVDIADMRNQIAALAYLAVAPAETK